MLMVDEEMRSYYVEMPVGDWLSEWMPGENPPIPARSDTEKKFDFSHLTFDCNNKNPDMVRIAKEGELYPHMVRSCSAPPQYSY